MPLAFFWRGIALGFAIAAPVGPIGVLCIRRTLVRGRALGFISGLGAATADAFYGCIAAFGLSALSSMLVEQQRWLRLIGGLFLCYLGARALLARPTEKASESVELGFWGAYGSTFALTLTNPMTILSFAAVFAGLGLIGAAGSLTAGLLVLGVFCGSALWWLTLSGVTGLIRGRLGSRAMMWINRLSGAVIVGFGLFALYGVWR